MLITRDGPETHRLRVMKCRSCGRTHRELPDEIIPYKRYSVEMVESIAASEPGNHEDLTDHSTWRRITLWVGSHEDSMQCYGRNEYEYDESGRVIKIDHTGTNIVSPFRILYDGSLEFGLNNIGIASLPSAGSSSNPIYDLEYNAYTTEYEYDESGRPTGYKNSRDGNVSAIHYSYDDETRTRKNISEGGNTIPGQDPGYVFDEKGRVLSYYSFSFQKNETKNTYDEDGKISEILGLTYGLDPDGNWSAEPVNGGTLTTYIYTYGDYTVE